MEAATIDPEHRLEGGAVLGSPRQVAAWALPSGGAAAGQQRVREVTGVHLEPEVRLTASDLHHLVPQGRW